MAGLHVREIKEKKTHNGDTLTGVLIYLFKENNVMKV